MRCLQVPDFSKHCPSFQSDQKLSSIGASENPFLPLLHDVHFLASLYLWPNREMNFTPGSYSPKEETETLLEENMWKEEEETPMEKQSPRDLR